MIQETTKQEQHSLLTCFERVAHYIHQAVPLDCMVGVTDKDKFLTYIPANQLDIGDIVGTKIPEGDAIYEAVRTGKVQTIEVPEEVFGIPFKATGVPIKNENNQVIGGLGIGVSLENQQKLNETAQLFASTSEEIAAETEELASSAKELSDITDGLNQLQKDMVSQVEHTGSILDFINTISESSKILGLNAGIEAARAGEHGRGFAVVAKEIRKMAENSSKSVSEIKEITALLHDKVKEVNDTIQKVSEITNQQSKSTDEISSAMEQLASIAEDIENVSKIL